MYCPIRISGKPSPSSTEYVDITMADHASNAFTIQQTNDVAHMLAKHGMRVDIQGIVVHGIGVNTVAFSLAIGASLALSALLWPLFALVGIIATIGATLADLDAGHGWLRNLVTKELSENIIAWPTHQTLTKQENTPTLVITCPGEDRIAHQEVQSKVHLLPLGALLGSAVIVAAQPWLGSDPTIVVAVCLAGGSIIAWSNGWLSHRKANSNPSKDVLLRSFQQTKCSPHLRVIWAIVGGGTSHHDGLQTFLLNHRAQLPHSSTRVLALHPSTGACSWVRTEGRVRTTDADPILGELAALSKITQRNDTTGARKAHQLGWRATGLCVSNDQIHVGTQVVCTIIQGAERLVRAGKW